MSKKNYSRSERISEQIKRELAGIILFELKDPRIGMVSLTGVEISPDYAHAKVFYTVLSDNPEERELIAEGLLQASGFMRSLLSRRIRIHTIPELNFVFDHSIEYGMKMNALIDEAMAVTNQTEKNNKNSEN